MIMLTDEELSKVSGGLEPKHRNYKIIKATKPQSFVLNRGACPLCNGKVLHDEKLYACNSCEILWKLP